MAEVEPACLSDLGKNISRKHSKHGKDANLIKKRHRNSNGPESIERKSKRSKSNVALDSGQNYAKAIDDDSISKQKQKDKVKSVKANSSYANGGQAQNKTAIRDAHDNGTEQRLKKTQSKKISTQGKHQPTELEKAITTRADSLQQEESQRIIKKPEKEKKKRPKKDKESYEGPLDDVSATPKVVIIDSSPSTPPAAQPSTGKLSYHQHPFYTQTVSQYLPLHPSGISEPIRGYTKQHLKPLLNRYVPSFGGVLLAYRNPRIGEAPGKGSLTQHSRMEDMIVLESVNEHAVSFGWLTVEIDIFRPARGAWLEGLVNLQGEGHIGVVCWGKFNASIESGRLPRGWRWIDQLPASNKKNKTDPETTLPSPSLQDDIEADHTQVHSTGYWVDEQGSRIKGDTPICFRIRNYEVGNSGDYGYLSIEGTMLTEEEEEKKVCEEIEDLRYKLRHGAVLRRERRPLLESSMTKFGENDEREPERQRPEVWTSRRASSLGIL
ncbi:hypothetical protein HD806DRAFT_487033 [Xylariaceae sp. AK1471]|nr:hypothetical protein HD806DRAFT_487033 [Xylariaceae sp. AK1471]